MSDRGLGSFGGTVAALELAANQVQHLVLDRHELRVGHDLDQARLLERHVDDRLDTSRAAVMT